MLYIEAQKENYGYSFDTSARLRTQGLQEFQYGRIGARIKVPTGDGTWPAFWMLGAGFDNESEDPAQQWPNVGEIDIMEHVGHKPDLVRGTVHGPGYSGAAGLSKWFRQDADIADDFHVDAVECDAGGIRWFFDDEVYDELTPETVGDPRPRPRRTAPRTDRLDVEFPLDLYVDDVRVCQPEPGSP